MGATYGGIPFSQPLPETVAWVERNISTAEVFEFQRPVDAGLSPFLSPDAALDRLPLKTNSLFWPRSASRWAYGHFFCTENQLGQIRKQTSVTTSPLPLVLTDPANSGTLTTNLSMLPARPLAQFDGANGLYLITLVDDRYFWWNRAAQINVSPGNTQWSDLYYQISRGLQINNIAFDTIDPAYLTPPISLASAYGFLPLLLDAVAYSVGQRITRDLNGVVYAKNYAGAKSVVDGNIAMLAQGPPRVQAGGTVALDETVTPNDLNALVPSNLTMVFQEAVNDTIVDGQGYAVSVALAGLAIEDYGDATGYPGDHVVHNDAVATLASLGASASNQDILDDLTEAFARDWYSWQLGFLDTKWAGLVNWTPDGLHDHVEWVMRYPGDKSGSMAEVSTRVQRPPWNEIIEAVFHHTVTVGTTEPPPPPTPSTVFVQHDTLCVNGILNIWMKQITWSNGFMAAGSPFFSHTAGCCTCSPPSTSSSSSSSSGSTPIETTCLFAILINNPNPPANLNMPVRLNGQALGNPVTMRGTLFLPESLNADTPPQLFDPLTGAPITPLDLRYPAQLDSLNASNTINLLDMMPLNSPVLTGSVQVFQISISEPPNAPNGDIVLTPLNTASNYSLSPQQQQNVTFNVTCLGSSSSSASSTSPPWHCYTPGEGGIYGNVPTCAQENEANGGGPRYGDFPDLNTCLGTCGGWYCINLNTPEGCDDSPANPCDRVCLFYTAAQLAVATQIDGYTIISGPSNSETFCNTNCTRLWYCVFPGSGANVCLYFTAAQLSVYLTNHVGSSLVGGGYQTQEECAGACGCPTGCDIQNQSPTPSFHFTVAGVVNGTCTNCDVLNGTFELIADGNCIWHAPVGSVPVCSGSNPAQWFFLEATGNTWQLLLSPAFNDEVSYLSDGACWNGKTALTLTRDRTIAQPGTSCNNWPETIIILP